MRTFILALSLALSLALALPVSVLPGHAADDAAAKAAAHETFLALGRWGMCVLETNDEATTRGIMMALVMKVDRRFQTTYGVQATNLARERFGEDFVQTYYGLAKAEHDRLPQPHTQTCRLYGAAVVALTR